MERKDNGQFVKSLLYGLGYDDTDYQKERREYNKDRSRSKVIWYDKSYSCWKNIIKRCSSKRDKPSYFPVRICDEWIYFSNFKKWYDANYIDGYEIDKDLLSGFLYSPDTCIFIPRVLNTFIIGVRNKNTGVWFDKSRNKYQAYITINKKRKHLGRYDEFEEAKNIYLIEKKKSILDIINSNVYSNNINNALSILIKEFDSGLKYKD